MSARYGVIVLHIGNWLKKPIFVHVADDGVCDITTNKIVLIRDNGV